MVIIFPLLILVNLKYRFWFAIIEESFLDKKLLTDSESDTSNLTAPSSYEEEKVETMLGFVDQDRLAYMA